MKSKGLILSALVLLMLSLVAVAGAQPIEGAFFADTNAAGVDDTASTNRYIIRFSDAPVALYEGGVTGFAATNPAANGTKKLDLQSPATRAYASYLESQQAGFLSAASADLGRSLEPAFTYQYAFNGMALDLTGAEADAVARMDGVAHIQPEFVRYPQTDFGPQWISADTIWDGSASGVATQGEGVTVGIIDTGINLDHDSFAAVGPIDSYARLCCIKNDKATNDRNVVV